MPQAYWIIPLEGGRIDNTLPGGPPDHISNRPIYHPGHPEHGLPSAPGHPANRPPGSWSGEYPSGGPVYPSGPTDPGYGQGHPVGGYPGNWVPGSGEYPSGQPIAPPQGGTDVPEDVYTPAPVPEEIASQYVVTVYDPKTMTYTTKSYPPR
jgi:hypothetical protein